tara:strand:+ start:366 stop:740 length:375 start_codon:yes stop_codon:yes gene_type:complete
MKKYLLLILMVTSLGSLLFSKDISPVFSIRYDNLTDGIVVSDAVGLKMNIDGSKYSGFDSDGTDYRIFLGWAFGKVGFGSDGTNQEFTVGATYGVLDNLSLDLDYVMGTGTGDANLRMGLQVHF